MDTRASLVEVINQGVQPSLTTVNWNSSYRIGIDKHLSQFLFSTSTSKFGVFCSLHTLKEFVSLLHTRNYGLGPTGSVFVYITKRQMQTHHQETMCGFWKPPPHPRCSRFWSLHCFFFSFLHCCSYTHCTSILNKPVPSPAFRLQPSIAIGKKKKKIPWQNGQLCFRKGPLICKQSAKMR